MSHPIKIAVSAAGLVLSLVFWFFSILLFLFCTAHLIAKKTRLSLISSMAISTIIFVSIVGLFEYIFDILSPNTPNFLYLNILLSLASCFYIYYFAVWHHSPKDLLQHTKFIHKDDLAPLLGALLAFLFLVIPVVGTRTNGDVVYYLSNGEDNASHFAMYNHQIVNQSAPYLDKQAGLIDALKIYPQGLHSAMSYLTVSVFGANASTHIKLILYCLFLFSVSSLLVFFMLRTITLYGKTIYKHISALMIGIAFILTVLTWSFVMRGFLSQIFAFATLLSLVILFQSAKTKDKDTLPVFAAALLLLTSIVFSWYLLLPVAVYMLVPLTRRLLIEAKNKGAIAIFLILTVSNAGIILLNILAGKGTGGINENGGVYIFNPTSYWIYGAITISYLIYTFLYRKERVVSYLDKFIISTTILTASVGIYQLLTVHEVRYYYYKLMMLVIVGVFILVGMVSSTFVGSYLHKKHFIALSVLIIVTTGFYLKTVKPEPVLIYMKDWTAHSFTSVTANEALKLSIGDTTLKRDVLVISDCTSGSEYLLNRWTGAVYLSNSTGRSDIAYRSFHGTPDRKQFMVVFAKSNGALLLTDTSCIR